MATLSVWTFASPYGAEDAEHVLGRLQEIKMISVELSIDEETALRDAFAS